VRYNRNNYNRSERCYERNDNYVEICYKIKNHNHEFLSSTDYEEDDEGVRHNHRIAGTTGPAIKCGESHIHKIETLTDTFDDHFHGICDTTGPAIYLSGGKHIHLVKGQTTCNDGHRHDYFFVTLIEDPSSVPGDKEC
jgi:hypothetical protein